MMKKAFLLLSLLLLSASAAAAADFYVVSVSLSENAVEEGYSTPVGVSVLVKNQGSTQENCWARLSFLDASGADAIAPKIIDSQQISEGDSATFTYDLDVSDADNWPAGNYTVKAEACTNASCSTVQGSGSRVLTILHERGGTIPETAPFLPFAVALAVLALLFFSSRGSKRAA